MCDDAHPRVPCPCCGYLTMADPEHYSYDICPVCYWEDDWLQFHEPDRAGGANVPSLNEARKNYQKYGAMEERFIKNVRPPRPEEIP